tara:strand:- start:396 stop:746 length:351 start_codon:yes stop_codon:yes gene_type:complete
MSHFAKIVDGIVETVIVAEQDFIDGQEGTWVQTSYNTRGGVHLGQDLLPDGGVALRKNYAGAGFSYDSVRDAFIPPKPFASWVVNEGTCLWNAPVPYPEEGEYTWDEDAGEWVAFE